MQRLILIVTLVLVVAAFSVGSGGFVALAHDSSGGAADGGFAESAPAIPGYNESYSAPRLPGSAQALSGSRSATAPIIPGYNDGERVAGEALVARDGFGAVAAQLPGYNAPYPTPGGVTHRGAPSGSWSATAPFIPGYSAAYPALGAVTRAPSGSWSATAPFIPGYTAAYPILGGMASTE